MPNDRFKEFQEYVGKQIASLGDLEWDITKTFLERIPSDLERVDFLLALKKLPDDGVVNNIVVNPASSKRNQVAFVNPLNKECSRLISHHFNLESILNQAERLTDHTEALAYLWNVLRAYKKYHPNTLRGEYYSDELAFCKTIETEIQHRKDLQSVSSANKQEALTRVDRAVKWFKNNRLTSAVLICAIFVGAVAAFWGQIKPLGQDILSVWPSNKYKTAPSKQEIEEWARTVNPEKKVDGRSVDIEKIAPQLLEANAETRSVYNTLLSRMREVLKAYQKNPSANIYIQIPDLPNNVLTQESQYRGGAIFSRNAAWTIFLNPKDSPTLEIHFMNGDGHTIGGAGIGEVKFQYDLQNKIVNVTASGVGLAAFGKPQEKIPIKDFDVASSVIVKSFLDYQLKHL